MKKGGGGEVDPGNREKPLRKYIERREATVAEWFAPRPVFEVCTEETRFEGGGREREQWWRQTAVERQLKTTLEEILEASRDQQRQEFERRGEGKGGSEESDSGNEG